MVEPKPQIPPPRFPVREFVTPNPVDGFYTETFNRTDPAYMAVQVPKRGTLYSTIKDAKQDVIAAFPNLFFLKETRLGNSHEWVLWIWGTDPLAEDTYNATVTYSGDSTAHPIFQRTRTVRRDVYEKNPIITTQTSLTVLLAVNITAAGTGYTQATGTTGTGATVVFICAAGQLIAGIVTNSGTGCTNGGAVTITGDGTGGTATAIVQPTTALLVAQKKQEFPNDSPFRNEYVEVLVVYETLPGPLLAKPGFNTELGTATTEYKQRVALPASAELIGTVFNGQVVVDSFVDPGESAVAGNLIIECWSTPPSRTERESIGYQFPAQFNFITGWDIPVTPGFQVAGPFPGVNFTLTAHRTLSTPASTTYTYSNGPPTVGETVFSVVTPGKADRFFGIQDNTIHNPIFVQETEPGPIVQTVEDLPASTPSGYTPGTTLTIRVNTRLVKGTIWEKRVTTCHE